MMQTEGPEKGVEASIKLGEKNFPLREYRLAPLPEGVDMPLSPDTMITSNDTEAIVRHAKSPLLANRFFDQAPPLPYAFFDAPSEGTPFGMFETPKAQDVYSNSYARVTEKPWIPPEQFKSLHRYVQLAKGLPDESAVLRAKFRPEPQVLTLQGLTKEKGSYQFLFGKAHYSDAFLWNGQAGLRVVSPEELMVRNRQLAEELGESNLKELGDIFEELKSQGMVGKTVGDIIAQAYKGEIPPYADSVAPNSVGVATLLISGEKNSEERSAIFVTRDPRYISVDTQGLYFTSAGAADYDPEAMKLPDRLHVSVPSQAAQEINQELGAPGVVYTVGSETVKSYVFGKVESILMRETGLDVARAGITLRCIGAAAELSRIQKPEFMFRADVSAPVEEIVAQISAHRGGGRKEIQGVFSMNLSDAFRLVHTPGSETKIHPKLALALLILEKGLG